MSDDKIIVKAVTGPSVKITDDQTIVREIKIGAPIKGVQAEYIRHDNLRDSGSGMVFDGPIKLGGSIIPDSDGVYDLGSPTRKFKSLYLGTNTLFIGNTALSANPQTGGVTIGQAEIDSSGEVVVDAGTGAPVVNVTQVIATDLDSAVITNIIDSAYVSARGLQQSAIDSAITQLIGGAPGALNTLSEISAAINDDPGFISTISELFTNQQEAIANSYDDANFDSAAKALIDSAYVNALSDDPFNLLNTVDSDLTLTSNNQIIDVFDKTLFRTVKYIIQLEHDSDNKYHSAEILLTHNGSVAFITEYALVYSDSSLGEFDATIDSLNVSLSLTPSYTNTSIKAKRISLNA